MLRFTAAALLASAAFALPPPVSRSTQLEPSLVPRLPGSTLGSVPVPDRQANSTSYPTLNIVQARRPPTQEIYDNFRIKMRGRPTNKEIYENFHDKMRGGSKEKPEDTEAPEAPTHPEVPKHPETPKQPEDPKEDPGNLEDKPDDIKEPEAPNEPEDLKEEPDDRKEESEDTKEPDDVVEDPDKLQKVPLDDEEETKEPVDKTVNNDESHGSPPQDTSQDSEVSEPVKVEPPIIYERAWFSNDPYTFPQAPTDRQCMREAYYLSQARRALWKDTQPEKAICEDNLSNMIPRIAHCEAEFAVQGTNYTFPDDEMTNIKDGYQRLEKYCSDYGVKLKFNETQFVESVDTFGDREKIIAFYEKYDELRPADGVDHYSETGEWWPSRWSPRGAGTQWHVPDWKGGPSSVENDEEKKWYQRIFTEAYVQTGCAERKTSTECFCSNTGGGLVNVAREVRARKFLESPFYIIRHVEDIETWPPANERGEPFKDIEPFWRKAYQGIEESCQSAGNQSLALDFDHFARSAMDYSDELFYSPVLTFTGNEWDEFGSSLRPVREVAGDSESDFDSLVPILADELRPSPKESSKLPDCVKVPVGKDLLTPQSPDFRINDQYGPLSDEVCHELPSLRPLRKQVQYQGPPMFRLYRPDVIIPKPAPAGFPKLSKKVPEEQQQLRIGFKKDDYYDDTVLEPDNAPQIPEQDRVKYRGFIQALEPWQQVSFVIAATAWEEIHAALLLSNGDKPWDQVNALLEDPKSVLRGTMTKSDLDVISLTALQVAARAEDPRRFLTRDLREVVKKHKGDDLWLKVATSPATIHRVNNYLKVEMGEKVWQSILDLSKTLDLTGDIGVFLTAIFAVQSLEVAITWNTLPVPDVIGYVDITDILDSVAKTLEAKTLSLESLHDDFKETLQDAREKMRSHAYGQDEGRAAEIVAHIVQLHRNRESGPLLVHGMREFGMEETR